MSLKTSNTTSYHHCNMQSWNISC